VVGNLNSRSANVVSSFAGAVLLGLQAIVASTTDWSQHHLIFSKPATAEQARRVERDPRYWQQQNRQSPISLLETETGRALGPEVQPGLTPLSLQGQENNKDWSQNLGSGATVGATNYPAKYGFQGTTATCAGGATQPDFVVYGTGLAGSATQASIVAYDNIYSGCSIDGLSPRSTGHTTLATAR